MIVWMVMLAGTILRVVAQLKYRSTHRLSELASRNRKDHYQPLGWRLYKLGTACMLVGVICGSLLIWLALVHHTAARRALYGKESVYGVDRTPRGIR